MFFSKKKTSDKPKKARPRGGNEFGIPGIPGFDPNVGDNDADLEAELLALTGGTRSKNDDDFDLSNVNDDDLEGELARILGETKKKPRRTQDAKQTRPANLPKLKSIDSVEGDDDDIDENDPDLLNELNEIAGEDEPEEEDEEQAEEAEEDGKEEHIPSQLELIKSRLQIYKEAEASAKSANDSSRARRFNRGVKSLEKLYVQAQSGVVVPADEIPPEIARPKAPGASQDKPKQLSTPVSPIVMPQEVQVTESKEKEDEYVPSQIEQIKNRLAVYKEAESIAKGSNDSARARRYNRGVKTLEMLFRQAQSGAVIPADDIPPEIALPKPAAHDNASSDIVRPKPSSSDIPSSAVDLLGFDDNTPLPSEDLPPPPLPPRTSSVTRVMPDVEPIRFDLTKSFDDSPTVDSAPESPLEPVAGPSGSRINSGQLQLLQLRRDEYKRHALVAKKSGDLPKALELVRAVKSLDKLIQQAEAGNTVADADIPSPLSGQTSPTKSSGKAPASAPNPGVPYVGEVFSIPNTVMEALNQRLNYYIKAQKKAELIGQRIQAKKCSTIVLAYQNAIKLHQKGANVPYEKLPTPPGCPPIPIAFRIN